MSTALYRRYRPDSFADVVGQEHVTGPLRQALRSDRVNHAYLFSGPRGCGKTTSARILARILNCHANTTETPTDTPCGTCPSCVDLATGGPGSLDVVEIDAASHGGVDDARELRERATFSPTRDRFKIFILDEAHMVTPQGFNALLKIVEEPPAYLKFIFATTEPDKVIGTIRSRTHHYPFRLVPPEVMVPLLEKLCASENVTVGSGVLPLVVRAGGGSVRDTLSVMDQLIAGSGPDGVDYELAVALLGYTHATLLDDAVESVASRDGAALFRVVDRVVGSGHEPRRFVEDVLERLRDLIVLAVSGDDAAAVLRDVPADQLERMRSQAAAMGTAELSRAADLANDALTTMSGATSPRMHLELLCARLLLPAAADGEQSLAARLDRLERGLGPAARQGGETAPGTPHGAAPHGAAPLGAASPGAGAASREGSAPAGPRGDTGRGASAARAALAAATGRGPGSAEPATTALGTAAPSSDAPATAAPATAAPATVTPATVTPVADAEPASQPGPGVQTEPDGVARRTAAAAPPPWDVPGSAAGSAPVAEPAAPAALVEPDPPVEPTATVEPTASVEPAAPAEGAAPVATPSAVVPEAAPENEVASAAATAHDVAPAGEDAPAPERAAMTGPAPSPEPAAVHEAEPEGVPTPAHSDPDGAASEVRAPATAAGEDSETLRRRWDEVLATLADLKKATWVLVKDNARVAELTPTTLRLAFTAPGLVGAFSNGPHAGLVQQAVKETLGYDVRVEGEVQGDGPVGQKLQETSAPTTPTSGQVPSSSPQASAQPAAAAPAAGLAVTARLAPAPSGAAPEPAEPQIIDSWEVVPVGTWTPDEPAAPRQAAPEQGAPTAHDATPIPGRADLTAATPDEAAAASDETSSSGTVSSGATTPGVTGSGTTGSGTTSAAAASEPAAHRTDHSPAPASASPAAAAPGPAGSSHSGSTPAGSAPASRQSAPATPRRAPAPAAAPAAAPLSGAAAARAAALAGRGAASQSRTSHPDEPPHDDVPPPDEPSYEDYEDSVPFTETTLMGVPLVVQILGATVLEEITDTDA